jgi:hypothetical protein
MSHSGRNDKNGLCDTVSKAGIRKPKQDAPGFSHAGEGLTADSVNPEISVSG